LEFDDKSGKLNFVFGEREGDPAAEEALRNAEVIADCPVCKKGKIREGASSFVCDQSIGAQKSCEFRMGKTILQRSIAREQVVKIAEMGRTDLISGFVSKKGRKFSAFLKLDGKKVGFEFEPRAHKSHKGDMKAGSSTSLRKRLGKSAKTNPSAGKNTQTIADKAVKSVKSNKKSRSKKVSVT
jgi:DNA topoisomerase-3